LKLNTHNRTPRPENNSFTKVMFLICAILIYSIFGLVSFACFYYAQSFIGGMSVILIPVLLTAIILIHIKDIEKAYIEIKETEVYVVDYYLGVKKEKHISFSDITSAEICMGNTHKVKGYRLSSAGMRYIIFKQDEKYLFKIIYLSETEEIFKQYLQ